MPIPRDPDWYSGRCASIRPRLRSRGDEHFCQGDSRAIIRLQFGHGCGAVEMGTGTFAVQAAQSGFNSATAAEPWRFARVCFEADQRLGASIRPRLWSRGDQFTGKWSVVMLSASIRPRLRSRGDIPTWWRPAWIESPGFNSATAAEPWRSQVGGIASGGNEIASIRPRLRSRGDFSTPSSSAASRIGFNSATAAEPWRCRWATFHTLITDAASIRPRLRSRGDNSPGADRFALEVGFNSATAAEPWRYPRIGPHACTIASSFNSATAAEPWRSGPIRPHREDQGGFNSATAAEPWRCGAGIQAIIDQQKLQFGHGCGAVEIWPIASFKSLT